VTQPRLPITFVLLAFAILAGCQPIQQLDSSSVANLKTEKTLFGVDPAAMSQSESIDSDHVETTVSSGDQSAEVLIQEPKLRSTKKPEYSSGFRQSKNRSNFFMLQAFNDAIGSTYKCTVQLMTGGEQCALGTIVDSDGWIVTKASELSGNSKVRCLLSDRREFAAELVGTDAEMDVALLQIPTGGLACVEWEYSVPEQGRWLATTDSQSSVPTAIGVVSAGPVPVPNQRAVFGAVLENRADGGALITQVLMGSGAHEAGLRVQDSILEVDGKKIKSLNELLSLIRNGKGGQYLNLMVNREDNTLEKRVRLMDLSMEMLDETEMEVNGPISARSTGFGRVLMHDTVILPNQCGGPLVNLNGKAVGINIARAGRVSTYAIPADTLNPIINRLMQQAKLIAKQTVPTRVVSTDAAAGASGN
jgi:serine protease Do